MKKWQKMVWWISVAVYAVFQIIWTGIGAAPNWWATGVPMAVLVISAIIGTAFKVPEGP